jgi:hypothetical protein
MTHFHKMLDIKFDEFISNLKKKKTISINEVILFKSIIYDIYEKENEPENKYLRRQLHLIDFKI